MKKLFKILVIFILIFLLVSIATISVSALSWDGSSTGGGGAGYAAGPNGYAIRTTGDNCLGYRFSLVDKNGNNKVSKVIDVFRNTTYGNIEFSSAYKYTSKYNKKQLINYQNNGFSTSQNSDNCYKEIDMGFADALPVASGIGTWQNRVENLNPVINILGAGNINNLVNGDKLLVEPLYDIRLQSIYHSLTVTETALYGKWILGANSNGGYSPTSETWGFIAAYTNRFYPNELYTTDGQGLWTGATAVGSTSKATFYDVINKGYGVGIAYTETKPEFSPTLSVNVCEAWRGSKSDRSYHFGTTSSNTFSNFSCANGYPVIGDSVWFALNFPSENQAVRVRQYVRHGGNWVTRDVNLSSTDTGSQWFDVIFTGNEGGGSQPTNLVEPERVFYWIEAKQDWIDASGNILKYGAVKSFYIPIKPKVNRHQVTLYDITGSEAAKANAGSTNQVGAVYVGQRVYPKYTYTSNNTWTSYNYLRGAMYQWINGVWNTVYPNNGGTDLYVDNQSLNNTTPFERYSDIGLYTVPDNSANTNGYNRIPFKLWTHWYSDWQNTTEETWIDIPIVKADVELKEIRLIDDNNQYITGSTIYSYQKVTPQYIYKNNTDVNIFVEGFEAGETSIGGIYMIPANGEIYVNGSQITVPNQTSYSFWGGVYLEGAGIYNTSYETDGTNNTKSVTYTVEHPIKIEFITPNVSYRENTEVITSFKIKNMASSNFYPTSGVSVRFTAFKNSMKIYTSTKLNVVIPANGENLVYFKWLVPKNLLVPSIRIIGEVIHNGSVVNSLSNYQGIVRPVTSTTPDTQFEKNAPVTFTNNDPPDDVGTPRAIWSEWVFENNRFVRKAYGIEIKRYLKPDIIPDVNSPSRKYENNKWQMGSGYGFTLSWDIINANTPGSLFPLSASFVKAQTANVYFPEYNYSNLLGQYRTLEKTGVNQFTLPTNPYAPNSARLHYVPIWYPDKDYTVQCYVSDLWTPAGMLSAYMTSAPIAILNSAYNDWYIGR